MPVFQNLTLVLRSVLAMRPALRRGYGPLWPLALARCTLRSRELIRRTRWGNRRDAEARYVRSLALLPTICLDIRDRVPEQGHEIMRALTTAVVETENQHVAEAAGLFRIPDPSERWHTYFDRVIIQGVGAFNENECLSVDRDHFHYRVLRCVFADLARDMGVPELARIVCDLDIPFQSQLFPGFEFHRCGSAQNTLAYGHPCCEYAWDRRGSEPTGARANEPRPAAADVGPVARTAEGADFQKAS